MLRAYKYRIYPTEEQKILFAKTFGCCRFVYNWALNMKITAYKERKETLGNVYLTNLMKSELNRSTNGSRMSTPNPCRVRCAILTQPIPTSSVIPKRSVFHVSSHVKTSKVFSVRSIAVRTLKKKQSRFPRQRTSLQCCTEGSKVR